MSPGTWLPNLKMQAIGLSNSTAGIPKTQSHFKIDYTMQKSMQHWIFPNQK